MKLANTTGDFGRVTGYDYEKGVQCTYEAGFRNIDLSMYTLKDGDPLFFRDDWQKMAYKLKALGEKLGIQYVQSHSPGGAPYISPAHYEEYLWKTIRSIEVCAILGIPNIVVHTGVKAGMLKDEYFTVNGEFVKSLIPTMEKCGVNVLCENGPESDTYYDLHSGVEMREFIESINHPLFHGCWDTGHANMNGHQYDDIITVGEHLYALHINDNRGSLDEHVVPFFGTMNMDEVMHALLDIQYKGYFTFEAEYALRPADIYFGRRRTFEKDTRLFSPTVEMQKDMAVFIRRMGEHILRAYDCYEE